MADLPTDLTALVRLAAAVAAADEATVRAALERAKQDADAADVEEVLLQSYLFAGFPRALNAMREWRRVSGRKAPAMDESEQLERVKHWQARGERTCEVVYGGMYAALRRNVRELHPALDSWMIVEGYGKVLSREALPLRVRELCIVAACAAAKQDRQLHSHLHGALHAGATADEVAGTIEALAGIVEDGACDSARALWSRVVRRHGTGTAE